MPQIAKGGKWVFGWVVVGPDRTVPIPPEAWREYGFRVGDEAIFLPGSRTSGGFGLSTPQSLAGSRLPLDDGEHVLARHVLARHAVARSQFDEAGRIAAPPDLAVKPGDRLLTGRGSGYALGFIARGPIYKAALDHPEVEVFE